jgi:hypothetical protein
VGLLCCSRNGKTGLWKSIWLKVMPRNVKIYWELVRKARSLGTTHLSGHSLDVFSDFCSEEGRVWIQSLTGGKVNTP